MKVTAIAPWFGSKRSMAPQIVEALGPHRAYWEPFAGSLAVLLAKAPVSKETVNDLHGGAVCLARVLADELYAPQLYRRLYGTLFCEELFDGSRAHLAQVGTDPPWWLRKDDAGEAPGRRADANMAEYAYHFFVCSWMGRNGISGLRETGASFCVRYTEAGGDPGQRFRSAVDSIPSWHERLRHVWILRRDALKLLENVEDAAGTAIYCDPPYLEKCEDYLHDFSDDNHARLATLLGGFRKARVVVSYYDHPRLAGLYPGWRKLDFCRNKAIAQQNKRGMNGRTVAPEVLLVNGRRPPDSLFAED